MLQVARKLLDAEDGFLRNATHLIHDRDPLFTKAWTALLKSEGVNSVAIPARSPNCNPYAERFVKTVRSECLDHFVIFGERQLRHLLREFCAHYHGERFHQGLGGKLVRPPAERQQDGRSCRLSIAAWWTAELLSSRGRVKRRREFANTTEARSSKEVEEE